MILTKDDLKNLIETRSDHCVSIYLPTHRLGRVIQQDRLRLKNLVNQAEKGLRERGLNQPDSRALLRPARLLLRDSSFWRNRLDGLAIFLSDAFSQVHRLPCTMPEFMTIGARFYIKPLLSILSDEMRFFILTLGRESVQLYEATRWTISELPLTGIPQGVAEIVQYDETQKQVHSFSGTQAPGGRGDRPAVFYGHGDKKTVDKVNLLQYCNQVDSSLGPILRQDNLPLILIGVEYLTSIYRQANTYPHMLADDITGSPERLSSAEIHSLALQVIKPHLIQARRYMVSRYERLVGTRSPQAIDSLLSIVPAAHHGRVETLFLAANSRQWGAYNPQTGAVEQHSSPGIESEELLDLSAVFTLLADGSVLVMKPEEMPAQAPAAAILRF
jgi:hypothetical protein